VALGPVFAAIFRSRIEALFRRIEQQAEGRGGAFVI
jgi:hypothetical protein